MGSAEALWHPVLQFLVLEKMEEIKRIHLCVVMYLVMCVYLCVSVCIVYNLCECVYLCVSMCIFVHLCVSVCGVCMFIEEGVWLSVSICVSVYVFG